jgi:hypothetical protein
MNPQTARALIKSINRHLKKTRAFVGGRQYGIDWPTWCVTFPQLAHAVNEAGHVLMQTNDSKRHFMPRFNY